MTLSLIQSATAVAANCPASFLGIGGTEPYSYAVLDGGPGGSIDPATGEYTGPVLATNDPQAAFDTIQVTDSLAATATAKILIGTPLILLCDIIQQGMGLDNAHCYLWDQKNFQPTDSNLYAIVEESYCKPYANVNSFDPTNQTQNQWVNVSSMINVDLKSRGPAARDSKLLLLLALNNDYAQRQQTANGFYIGKLPPAGRFINLSGIDGAAIPYRYRVSFALNYCYNVATATQYYDSFSPVSLITNP